MSVDDEFWGPERRAVRLPLSRSPLVNLMGMLIAVLIAATVIGVVELWPHGQVGKPQGFGPTRTDGATVTRVSRVSCGGSGAHGCQRVDVKLTSGPNSGRTTHFTIVGQVGAIVLAAGDHIRVYPNRLPPGAVNAAGHKLDPYSFSDFDRRSAMLWLAVGFVVLLLLTGRFRGLRALLGLAGSLVIVVEFVIPAILHGRSPVEVAVIGAFAVILVTMPLSYGSRSVTTTSSPP